MRALAQDGAAYRKLGQVWLEGDHLCRALLARGAFVDVEEARAAAHLESTTGPDAGVLSALKRPQNLFSLWDQSTEDLRKLLEKVGIPEKANARPTQLSGGQQQRVAIARAIVTDPPLLLADEPTGNLDTRTSREIMELVSSLNRDHKMTVVMVTHEPDIAAYARRVVRFVDGRIDSDIINKEAA